MEQTPLCRVTNDYLVVMRQRVQDHISMYMETVVECNAEIVTTPGETHSWIDIKTDNHGLLIRLGILIGKHLEHRADKVSI